MQSLKAYLRLMAGDHYYGDGVRANTGGRRMVIPTQPAIVNLGDVPEHPEAIRGAVRRRALTAQEVGVTYG